MNISSKKFDIIAYDFISSRKGGGEILLNKVLDHYQNAKLALLFESEINYPNREMIYSFLQYLPKFIRKRPRILLPLIPLAIRNLAKKLPEDKRILAISNAYIKNLTHPNLTVYLNSPARLLWSDYSEIFRDLVGNNKLLGPIAPMIARYFSKLRDWDYLGNEKEMIANSKHIALRIKKYYRKNVDYAYPIEKKYEKKLLSYQNLSQVSTELQQLAKTDFFLSLGNLAKAKKIDVLIELFKSNPNYKLLIVGDGSEKKRLQKQAQGANNIHFLGRINEASKIYLYQQAQAFLFPGIEDFGLTILDSAILRCPIIALNSGGAQEIAGDFDYLVNNFEKITILPILEKLLLAKTRPKTNNPNLEKIFQKAMLES